MEIDDFSKERLSGRSQWCESEGTAVTAMEERAPWSRLLALAAVVGVGCLMLFMLGALPGTVALAIGIGGLAVSAITFALLRSHVGR